MISAKEKNKWRKGETAAVLEKVTRDGLTDEREWAR